MAGIDVRTRTKGRLLWSAEFNVILHLWVNFFYSKFEMDIVQYSELHLGINIPQN